MNKRAIIAITAILTLSLTSCDASLNAEPEPLSEGSIVEVVPDMTPVENTNHLTLFTPNLDPNIPTQPSADAYGIEAAVQLITIQVNLTAQGRYQEVCELYSPEYMKLKTYEASGTPTEDCTQSLRKVHVEAKRLDPRKALTPFYHIPSSYGINTELMTPLSDTVIEISTETIQSLDPTIYKDGLQVTPGWLKTGGYVMKNSEGVWVFATESELP